MLIDDQFFLEMAASQARTEAQVKAISKLLEDNGQPGLISRFNHVAAMQAECQRLHAQERLAAEKIAAKLERDEDRRAKKIVAYCVATTSVVTWLLNFLFGG